MKPTDCGTTYEAPTYWGRCACGRSWGRDCGFVDAGEIVALHRQHVGRAMRDVMRDGSDWSLAEHKLTTRKFSA